MLSMKSEVREIPIDRIRASKFSMRRIGEKVLEELALVAILAPGFPRAKTEAIRTDSRQEGKV